MVLSVIRLHIDIYHLLHLLCLPYDNFFEATIQIYRTGHYIPAPIERIVHTKHPYMSILNPFSDKVLYGATAPDTTRMKTYARIPVYYVGGNYPRPKGKKDVIWLMGIQIIG